MEEPGGILTLPLVTHQRILVRLLGFWERRIEVDSKHIGGLKEIFPLLPDVVPVDTFGGTIQCLAQALREEIAQRQDALKKLRAAHTMLSAKVIQRDTDGSTHKIFAKEIDWLNKSVKSLNSGEGMLNEDRTAAELASKEPKRPASSLTKRGGFLKRIFQDITGPGPSPSPQLDGIIADLHFRHQVFAINLERDKLKASIKERTSEWVATLGNCLKAMKNVLTTFADTQNDLGVFLNNLGSHIQWTAQADKTTPRTTSFAPSINDAIHKRLLPPLPYVNFMYQQSSAMPVAHTVHYIIFGCSIPETRPETESPQGIAINAFYCLLRQPYQPYVLPTSDVSKMAHLFERYWSLRGNRERGDAPALGTEWEAATPDLVLHFLRCLPTPLLPISSQFESKNLENRSVVDDLMNEWGRGMEQETPRTHLLGAIRRYTIPYLGAKTEGHVSFLRKLAVGLTHRSDCCLPVNRLLRQERIGEMTWQWN